MPYVITTTTPEMADTITPGQPWPRRVSRDNVATLGEALEVVSTTVCDLMAGENFGQYQDEFRAIGESGGTIGPLPDGTVIAVRPYDSADLAIIATQAS